MSLLLSTAVAVTSTAYCLSGTMADGSGVRAGSVAHNGYPLGTKVTITPSPTGRRRYTVRDRIGWGTELDFWLPSCGAAIAWGRRTVTIRRGWQRHRHRPHRARRPPCRLTPHRYSRPHPHRYSRRCHGHSPPRLEHLLNP